MTYPTNAEIDAAVPPAGTPHRGLTNEVLKKLAAGPSISDIDGITAIGETLLQATDAEYAREALNAAEDNHTHDNATQTANGFMSSQDKVKLDGIQDGAQVNASWGSITGQPAVVAAGATAQAARDSIGAGTSNLTIGTTASTAAAGDHRHNNATSTADGFMSKEDKVSLTGILSDPTETTRGVPMEASDADVTAATSSGKMMSPRRVLSMIRNAVSASTETLRGTLRVGTQAEVDAGALDNAAVTPEKLRNGFAANLVANNGYIALPSWMGGLIVQWGSATCESDGTKVVVLPVAYTTGNFLAFVAEGSGAAWVDIPVIYAPHTRTLTQFSVRKLSWVIASKTFANTSGGFFHWLSLGK